MANPVNQDEAGRIIMLVRGVMESRGSYWCYLSIKPSQHKAFQAAVANKYNIQNFTKDGYGEVVVSGEGKEPPREVTEKVAELFNLSVDSLLSETVVANPEEALNKAIAEANS